MLSREEFSKIIIQTKRSKCKSLYNKYKAEIECYTIEGAKDKSIQEKIYFLRNNLSEIPN